MENLPNLTEDKEVKITLQKNGDNYVCFYWIKDESNSKIIKITEKQLQEIKDLESDKIQEYLKNLYITSTNFELNKVKEFMVKNFEKIFLGKKQAINDENFKEATI